MGAHGHAAAAPGPPGGPEVLVNELFVEPRLPALGRVFLEGVVWAVVVWVEMEG